MQGTDDKHPLERDEKFKNNIQVAFGIEHQSNGLYVIVMKSGGKLPAICRSQYTSYSVAKRELENYLAAGDGGYASYPSKPKDKIKPSVLNKNE